ncbi:MAG: N-acetylglucosamine-6-phosphate deacetylase [Akkermansiaceae bacterium]|jgi:N-acetylglucosamine-6-phosphate deacetylase|nr:N-acetylglucosamine-6-phosphate deacetylase [Akkermansiaceae bacterium]
MKTCIHNARVISPDVEIARGGLVMENGRILEVFEGDAPAGIAREIDAGGRMLMPGFFDIHCHGADRHDVCDDDLNAIRHIAKRKIQEGVTTWLPTTLTQPADKLASIMEKCAAYAAHPEFTRCPGVHVEGPYINVTKAGAQNPEFVRPPDIGELKRLHEICPALIVSLAPELPGAVELIAAARQMGITSSAAHTAATCGEILTAKSAGLSHLTHFGNAMTPLHHREIGVVGAGLMDDSLKIELICDTIHLCPDMLKLIFRVVPIERLMMITDSMAASWIDKGEVMLGGLVVVAENGTARLKEGGALAGSALRFNHGVKHVAEITGLPLHQIVKATSWNQACSLGLEGFGKIEPGFHADLVILDADFAVWKTLVGGEIRAE